MFDLTPTKLLALCVFISVVSTSPTNVSPNTPALARRHEPENDCPESTAWRSRECTPDTGPRDWQDSCRGVVANGMGYTVWVSGECAEGTVCQNTVDDDDDHLIECVVPQAAGQQSSSSSAQSGSSSEHTATTGGSTSEFSDEVEVSSDSTGSVSAMVLSSDQSFVLSPANIIVGKVHGKDITVCKGVRANKHRTRECYPTGRFELKKGQKLDFSWGMTQTQTGSLAYFIT